MLDFNINELNHIPPKTGYVYVLFFSYVGEYKIGKTINPKARFSQLSNQHGYKPKVIYILHTGDMDRIENYFHIVFTDKKICGRPGHKNNNSEYYHLDEKDIEFIKGRFQGI